MAKKYSIYPEWLEYERRELYNQVAKRIFENANRRYRNMKAKGLYSPAFVNARDTGGEFHAKGKSTEELVKELARAITFLNDNTSTVASAKKYMKAVQAATPNLTAAESKIMWEMYHKLRQAYPEILMSTSSKHRHDSDRLIEEISKTIIDKRSYVYGGLGGDLFSNADTAGFKNESAQRERALMSAIKEVRKKVEDMVEEFGLGIEETIKNSIGRRITIHIG